MYNLVVIFFDVSNYLAIKITNRHLENIFFTPTSTLCLKIYILILLFHLLLGNIGVLQSDRKIVKRRM